jgi:hypothetical protein
MKRRTVVGVVATVVVIISLVFVLVLLPVEATSFTKTAETRDCTGLAASCPVVAVEYTLGDSRFATLSGSWLSNGSAGDVVVTINNGGSAEPCLLCSGLLYTSLASPFPVGSFDVSGFGPFHVSVNQVGDLPQTTSIQGTVDSAVI